MLGTGAELPPLRHPWRGLACGRAPSSHANSRSAEVHPSGTRTVTLRNQRGCNHRVEGWRPRIIALPPTKPTPVLAIELA